MPITGLSFLLFALAAVVLYYLFPKRLRQYVLLAASILFYLTYGVRMAGYLAATILLTYLFGLWLDRLAAFRPAAETKEERKRQKRANDRKKRRVLALSLVLNFASLALLKYGGFLAAVSIVLSLKSITLVRSNVAAAAAFSSAARHILLHFPNLRLSDRYQPRQTSDRAELPALCAVCLLFPAAGAGPNQPLCRSAAAAHGGKRFFLG